MYEAQKKHGTGTDQELIEVLMAISAVSKRLAMMSMTVLKCKKMAFKFCKFFATF